MSVKNNQKTIAGFTRDNVEITDLRIIRTALKRALYDFEANKRLEIKDFDVYEFLFSALGKGFCEQTIRKWINPNERKFCTPDQLIAICKLIGDTRPIDLLISYLKAWL